MSPGDHLEVDTGCIRQSAATLDETGRRWSSAAAGAAPGMPSGGLGSDPSAVAVARLVALRCIQVTQATDQLAAVATGLSQQLISSADAFDRMDAGLRQPR